MGFIDKLKSFFKKEQEVIPQVIETAPVELVVQEPIISNGQEVICASCGLGITEQQGVKSFNGKKYHSKPCFRNLRRQAEKIAMGYKQ
jgi:hypothetical protein